MPYSEDQQDIRQYYQAGDNVFDKIRPLPVTWSFVVDGSQTYTINVGELNIFITSLCTGQFGQLENISQFIRKFKVFLSPWELR